MLAELQRVLPLLQTPESHPFLKSNEVLWGHLRDVLNANAPSGGAWLPGAIREVIGRIAYQYGLGEHFIAQIGATGNAGMALGADKPVYDVIVLAHMDRPAFRVDRRPAPRPDRTPAWQVLWQRAVSPRY